MHTTIDFKKNSFLECIFKKECVKPYKKDKFLGKNDCNVVGDFFLKKWQLSLHKLWKVWMCKFFFLLDSNYMCVF